MRTVTVRQGPVVHHSAHEALEPVHTGPARCHETKCCAGSMDGVTRQATIPRSPINASRHPAAPAIHIDTRSPMRGLRRQTG